MQLDWSSKPSELLGEALTTPSHIEVVDVEAVAAVPSSSAHKDRGDVKLRGDVVSLPRNPSLSVSSRGVGQRSSPCGIKSLHHDGLGL
jgi:hypothetical protein